MSESSPKGFDGRGIGYDPRPRLRQEPDTQRLDRMIAESPAIGRYVVRAVVRSAPETLDRVLQQVLMRRGLLRRLEEAHEQRSDPDTTTMIVIPGVTAIVGRYGDITSVTIPVMGCTYDAISSLYRYLRHGNSLTVYSDNMLETEVWERGEREVHNLFTFNEKRMYGEDYVALAARGSLTNEVFRRAVRI